jgi:GAF domain-containing protein
MDLSSDDLSTALDSLHELLLTAPEIETFLNRVAVLAAGLVEPAAACGITVRYDGNPTTVASSDDRAPLIDEEQYSAGQGPCLEALETAEVVVVGDQRTDPRWNGYASAARAKGVLSSMSVPLLVDGRPRGALNLYSDETVDAFSTEEVRKQALAFAERASIALTLTIRYNEQYDTSRQLEQALSSRALIDQAIGIVMAEQRCDARTAFDVLRQHSQNHNRKLRDVAEQLITRVSGAPPPPPSPFQRRPSD